MTALGHCWGGCGHLEDVEVAPDPNDNDLPKCLPFLATPRDRPCAEYTHCTRRGFHGTNHLFDHSLSGGAYFVDPRTGKTPLDLYRERGGT